MPKEIKKWLKYLDDKNDDPSLPRDSYLGHLEEFFHVASQSAGRQYHNRRFIEFNLDRFVETFVRPFLQDLKCEIVNTFELPEPLSSFSIFEPENLLEDKERLTEFGKKQIHDLASFYNEPAGLSNNSDEVWPLINRTALGEEFQTIKTLMWKQQLNYQSENAKSVFDKDQEINRLKKETASFPMGQEKIWQKESKISALEKERKSLSGNKDHSFVKFLQWWQFKRYSQRFPNISCVMNFAALIPTSTAEVEHSFSLMNLI